MALSTEDQVALERVLPVDAEVSSLCNIVPIGQPQCPLYTKIPGEIRSRIFELALREFEDKSKLYRPNRLYYRPGYHCLTKQDTRLLQTCRIIYQEARMMPAALRQFTYWLYGGPVSSTEIDLDLLTTEQRDAVEEVHLFVQQYYLEHCYPFCPGIQCKKFKITIRHSDWWSWESAVDSDDRLGICPWRHGERGRTTCEEMEAEPREKDLRRKWDEVRGARAATGKSNADRLIWGYELQFIKGLEIFEIELETDMRKKSQLDNVVEHAKYWRIPMGGDRELRWTGEARESSWIGVADLRSDGIYPDEQGDEVHGDDRTHEEIAALTPGTTGQGSVDAIPGEVEEQLEVAGQLDESVIAIVEEDTVPSVVETLMREYYVVTMRWDARNLTA